MNVKQLFQRVLTAEFIHGCRVDDVEGIKKMGLNVNDVRICLQYFPSKQRHVYKLKSFIS